MTVAVCLSAALLAETAIGLFGDGFTLRWLGIVGRLLVGAPPDSSSVAWSSMLIDGREAGLRAPWLFVFPFVCLIASAVGMLALGSGVADLLKRRDPAPTAILQTSDGEYQ